MVRSCGGGRYGHRYSSENGFDNPSVFCGDLRSPVEGIADQVTDRSFSPTVLGCDQLAWEQMELFRLFLAWDAGPEAAPHLDEVLGHPYARTGLQRSLCDPAEGQVHVAGRRRDPAGG